MKQYGKETLPGWGRAFSSDISDMSYYTYPSVMKSRGYEGAPEILRLKLPKKDIDKYNIYNFNANQKSQGLNPYAFGSNKPKDEFVLPIQDIIKAEKFGLDDIDNLYKDHKEFNTPHWLHGYKEVPKELPGSPNTLQTPAGFQNRVFDSNIQLGSFEGKGHLSEKGYNYRTLGDAEIKAIQESKGVFPKTGKAKGGNENVKYWTKGNEKNWYAENLNQQVIRIKDNKFSTDKVADANDIEIYNHETGAFESIIPKPATIKSGIGGIDMSRYEIKNPDYFTQLLTGYNSNVLSAKNKKFYKDLIDSVKKQNGLVTERQYNQLQRLKTGDFNFGKKGYADGGNVNNYTELELTAKEIKNYIDNGYIIEEIG
jgi:hypothetical protein